MKITVTETATKEIEITFPCSFKLDGNYYFLPNEKTGVVVYSSGFSSRAYPRTIRGLEKRVECRKSEVKKAFVESVKKLREIFDTEYLDPNIYKENITEREDGNDIYTEQKIK